jgi:predicted transcriptional regulator
MRRKIRYAFKSLLIISVHAGTEGFDLPVGEGCRECGRKGCSIHWFL